MANEMTDMERYLATQPEPDMRTKIASTLSGNGGEYSGRQGMQSADPMGRLRQMLAKSAINIPQRPRDMVGVMPSLGMSESIDPYQTPQAQAITASLQNQKRQELQNQMMRDAIKKRLGVERKQEIETKPDGSQVITDRMKTKNGAEITRKFEKQNPYAEQYANILAQSMNFKPTTINMQPLAQLMDTQTGSNFAQGYVNPQDIERRNLNDRIKAAAARYQLGQLPIETERKRQQYEQEMAIKRANAASNRMRALRTGMNKDKKSKWNASKIANSTNVGEGQVIEYSDLSDALRTQGVFERVKAGISKDKELQARLGFSIPQEWDDAFRVMASNADPRDMKPYVISATAARLNEMRDRAGRTQEVEEMLASHANNIGTTTEKQFRQIGRALDELYGNK